MESPVFRLVLAALLVGFMIHRGVYTRKVQHSPESVIERPEQGRLNQLAGLLALIALIGTLVYLVYPRGMAWASLPLPAWLRWLGVGISLSGFGLMQWAQVSLGQSWSDEPVFVEGQQLVVRGPYRWVRHPIYSAFLLVLGSVLLISANWFIGAAWIGMTSLDIASRIGWEESMLVRQFGEEYKAHQRRTGRLFPQIFKQ